MAQKFDDALLDTVFGVGQFFNDMLLDKDPRDIIDLIGIEDDETLVVSGLSFMSVFEIKGIYGASGQKEFESAVKSITQAISSRVDAGAGHLVKVFFESDPDAAQFILEENFRPIRAHIDACNLDLHDLVDEKIRVNAPYVQKESIFFAIYTSPKASQSKVATESIDGLSEGLTQVLVDSQRLRNIHKSTFNSIVSTLGSVFRINTVSVDQLLREIYSAINGEMAAKKATFNKFFPTSEDKARYEVQKHLPGLKVNPSKSTIKNTLRFARSNVITTELFNPKPLSEQLIATTCYDSGNKYVISGSRIYAPVAADKYGVGLKDFDHLISSMSRVPFRIAFTISPDGLSSGILDSLLMFLMSAFNEKNRMKSRAFDHLENLKHVMPIVKFSITACTWTNIDRKIDEETGKTYYDTRLLEKRLSTLSTALNDWSSVQVKDCAGDQIECLFSTFPGLVGHHCVETVSAPLVDILQILPITRPCAVWDNGASVYRTGDGRIIPVKQMSSQQASDVQIVAGPMGYGKSGKISESNISFILEPSATSDLPFVRGIDFGYSQSGWVSAIKSALPEHLQYKAKYELIKNDKEYCYNVHDLPLGNRYPLQSHKDFLILYLLTVTSSLSEFTNHAGMCEAAITLAYKTYSDIDSNPEAKRYKRNVNSEIDSFIDKHNLLISEETAWYRVTDILASMGNYRLASIAQRYAVPALTDYARIASDQEFTQEYNDIVAGRPIHELFARAIREALKQIPMLAGYTKFDVSESPIFIADLKEVIPTGDQPVAVQQKSAVIYLTMMRALCADFFADKSDLKFFNPEYREYHEKRISHIEISKKRMFADEKHRINKIPSASSALDQMVFEGRKYKISILQGSQLLNHFSPDIVKLATSVIICGSSSPGEINDIKERYELSDFHSELISDIRQPTKAGSQFFARFTTKSANINLSLFNTEGPIHLCLIATETEDRAVRDALQKMASSARAARLAYAKEFPSGRVNGEIEKRQRLKAEGAYHSRSGNFVKDIILDVLDKYRLIA